MLPVRYNMSHSFHTMGETLNSMHIAFLAPRDRHEKTGPYFLTPSNLFYCFYLFIYFIPEEKKNSIFLRAVIAKVLN